MKYEGAIIRPPSEAYSQLIQISVGCSHNRCTFCPAYKEKKIRIKGFDEIQEDILESARNTRTEKVFLCDGDALIIPQARLVQILESIRRHIRGVKRVGTYANAKSILRKTVDELTELKKLGLGIIYMGIETGNSELLEKIDKGVTYEQMVQAGKLIKEVGIPLSVTVILGLGGIEKSVQHAMDTARILTDIDPDYASALTLMLVPGTSLYEEYMREEFILPDQFDLLRELAVILASSNYTNCYFTSNHASNYLPVKATLPQEKEGVVNMIYQVIKSGDAKRLRPEYLRGL
ncbi:MAG: radical SAM protein [Deltaproteobacteria bacterium]|nr:radical SAM protein [Deltaproteobacteria bacterium]